MTTPILVVIPTLNRPEMCARAVNSLMGQSYQDWHCIVLLNGGHGRLGEYEESLGDLLNLSRIELRTIHEAGLGVALNSALDAVGDFGMWAVLEDDDEWHRSFLHVMERELRTSGAGVANCLQQQVPEQIQSNGGPMVAEVIRRMNWINWPECLWRREVYETVGPIAEDVGPATDWDWHLRCVQAGIKYHFVQKTLVTHHWHRDTASPNYCLAVDGKPYIAKKMQEGRYG